MRRCSRPARGAIIAVSLLAARAATGQLRPVEPFDWRAYAPRVGVVASLGVTALDDQRASLAGETGTLWELGRFHALVRLDRVVIEAYGTAVRRFEAAVSHQSGLRQVRQDAGAMHLATTVLMTPRTAPAAVALRFGVGIPTTDDRIGLDRDETDFFSTLMGRVGVGPATASASLGVGIFGARRPDREQNDVWLYDARVIRREGRVLPLLELVGHAATPGNLVIRGNEDLSELRAGVLAGRDRWVEVLVVRGLAAYSPRLGLRVSAGVRR